MPRIKTVRCDGCSRNVPGYEIVHYGSTERGFRQLCNRCVNLEVAQANSIEGFEHIDLEPVNLEDSRGKVHEFHFSTRLFGPGVALEAVELRKGEPRGYHFEVIGDPMEDRLILLSRLIGKMRRALSTQHLENNEAGLQIAERTVRGVIEADLDFEDSMPLLVIDGRQITWEAFGRLLMTFEGFQFKLDIADLSEEV